MCWTSVLSSPLAMVPRLPFGKRYTGLVIVRVMLTPRRDHHDAVTVASATYRDMSGTGQMVRVGEANSVVMLICLLGPAVPAGSKTDDETERQLVHTLAHAIVFIVSICYLQNFGGAIYLPPLFSNGPANKRRAGPSCDGKAHHDYDRPTKAVRLACRAQQEPMMTRQNCERQ